MLINLNKTAAYVCPFCSEVNTEKLSMFELSSDEWLTLTCNMPDCGDACVSMRRKKDKCTIRIECPVCGDAHTFTISTDALSRRPLCVFACPVSDVDIFFFGNEDKVYEAIENDVDIFSDSDEEFTEYERILNTMLARIAKLSQNGDLSCVCGCDNIRCGFTDEELIFSCPKCGRQKRLEICAESLMELFNAEAVIIK